MKKALCLVCLLCPPNGVDGPELPRVTEEGDRAAAQLVETCRKAGAIKIVTEPRTKAKRMVVADEAKLKEVVRQQREKFTPEVRNAFLHYRNQPGLVALLLQFGQQTGDDRAIAFARLFSADLLQEALKYREAKVGYAQAAGLFERLQMKEWQAIALDQLGMVTRELRDLPEARRLHGQALDIRRQLFGERHAAVATALGHLAFVYRDLGDLPQTRKLEEQALDIYKEVYGERHPQVATALSNLAITCREQGNLALARKLNEQALALRRELRGERHPDVANSLSHLAFVYKDLGDLAQTRKLREQALDIYKEAYGDRHPQVATALSNLAVTCQDQGNLALARKLLEQALALRRELHGERHPDVAMSLCNLAAVYRGQGNLPQARKLVEQALDIYKQIHGERLPEFATALANMAEVRLAQGDQTEAIGLMQQALDLRRELLGERHRDVATSLNDLSGAYHALENLPQARKLAEQALALRRELLGERHPDVAYSLNAVAVICRSEGDLPRARQLVEQALALRRQLHGERHPDVAHSLSLLAAVCHDLGDVPRARKLQEQALALHRQLHGERHPDVATDLQVLADVCLSQGELTRARSLFEQSLALRRELFGEHHHTVAEALNNLAVVCNRQGDLPAQRKFAMEALDLWKQFYGDRHPNVAKALHNAASIFMAKGDRRQAAKYHLAAALACRLPRVSHNKLADLRAEDLTCDASTVLILEELGRNLELSGTGGTLASCRQACHAYALAADLLDRLRADVVKNAEGKLFLGTQRVQLVSRRVYAAATLFDLGGQAQDLRTAFTAVEQGRARVFLESLLRAHSHQLGGIPRNRIEQEADRTARIRATEDRIQKENDKAPDRRDARRVAQLFEDLRRQRAELDRFAARLREDYPQYAALQYPRPCTIDEARACLGDNEVAVLFVVDQDEAAAVVLQKRAAPGDKSEGLAIVRLDESAVLEAKVRTLVDAEVLKSDSRCRELGAHLHDLLLKPLAKHIQGKDLVLVPDGVLWELPFELLVEGRTEVSNGKYLIETRKIRYTPSLTVLHLVNLWDQKRSAPAEPLWALGDPVFARDDRRANGDLLAQTGDLLERYALRGGAPGRWNRLPATRTEVEAIAKLHHAHKDDVVLDTSACERVLKTASEKDILSRKRYLHLATHGILGVGLGRQPCLVLSLVGNDGAEQLGGVNDGFLTLEEVTHLKLNADLVVLSACETGKGDLVPAEGVVGLSRAFLYAGSRGVVCSLWQVDDERTAALMQTMYTHLKERKPAAEALALARRQLIAQEQAPFFWAPFILIGK